MFVGRKMICPPKNTRYKYYIRNDSYFHQSPPLTPPPSQQKIEKHPGKLWALDPESQIPDILIELSSLIEHI